jgi:hypothetical protein
VRLWSRNGRDWSVEFATITAAMTAWDVGSDRLGTERLPGFRERWPGAGTRGAVAAAVMITGRTGYNLDALVKAYERHGERIGMGAEGGVAARQPFQPDRHT